MKQFEIENEFATGKVYLPKIVNKTYPGIIIVSGSDGGIPGNNAIPEFFIQEIVNHGFAVFALAYFGYNNLPPSLENIPLEYFLNAIMWFKSQDYINNNAVGIIGQSRGGELALILGTLIPNEFNAIVSIVPSDMVCGGFPHPNIPAWTYKDKSFSSFVGGLSNHDLNLTELQDLEEATKNGLIPYHKNTEDDPFIITDLFAARNKLDTFAVKIPVEKITSPILLLSGEDDAIWTSNQYCENIITRLKNTNSGIQYLHINYSNAGHGIIASYNGAIYHPIGNFWCRLGGTQDGNEEASKNSLNLILCFIEKYIKDNIKS